jgi:hypothetical protein
LIHAAKEGMMRGFSDAIAAKISSVTKNTESELKEIFKIYTMSAQEVAEHRWINCTNARINAYAHIGTNKFNTNGNDWEFYD